MTGLDDDNRERTLSVALLGAGNVGIEVARLLLTQADDLTARIGTRLELVGVGVRDVSRNRGVDLDPALLTDDLDGLVSRPDLDVVVELLGGVEPARTLILKAMAGGAAVVTGNKALLAEDGSTLYAAADANHVDLYYEAAVAGAIPLLRPLRESLVGDRVQRVLGIVNGTTNYILTRMDETGAAFGDALAEAQALGYAEADPTADVEGLDAAAKAAIIAGLAFHTKVTAADVTAQGITEVTADDVAAARSMGAVIKLLAVCERIPGGSGISVRVHPAMVPRTHPLASVREAYNAVFVESDAAGQLMFYGRGAGGTPTASAVVGDIVAAARNRLSGGRARAETAYLSLPIASPGEAETRYYLHLDVADKAGVLARVATTFAEHAVSIETLRQDGHGDDASLVIVTHVAREQDLADTVESLQGLDVVRDVASVMRVVGE